jgi:hypothetical protein
MHAGEAPLLADVMPAVEMTLLVSALALRGAPKIDATVSDIRTVAQYETAVPGTVGAALVVFAWTVTVRELVGRKPLSAASLQA